MCFLCPFDSGGLKSPPLPAECPHDWAQASFCYTGMSPHTGPFLVFPGGGLGRQAAHGHALEQPPGVASCSFLCIADPALEGGGANSLPDPGLKSSSGLGRVTAHRPITCDTSWGPFLCLGSRPSCHEVIQGTS